MFIVAQLDDYIVYIIWNIRARPFTVYLNLSAHWMLHISITVAAQLQKQTSILKGRQKLETVKTGALQSKD